MSDTTKILIEEVLGVPSRIDHDKGILYDCLLLGPQSRNGTGYPHDTREDALPLFEGAKINLSHPTKRGKDALLEATPWDRRYGRAFEVHNGPDGIRGNIKVLKSHAFTKTLMEAADEMPEMFGFSPIMLGQCTKPDATGHEICVKIKKVRSIDIVCDPGTTKSLFEDLDMDKELDQELHEEAQPTPEEVAQEGEHLMEGETAKEGALMHIILDEIEAFLDEKQDPKETSSRVGEHLKHHAKMHFGKEDKEESKDDSKASTEPKEEAKEEEMHWDFSRRDRGDRVLQEEVRPKVETKKVRSGIKVPAGPKSDTDWANFLRK